MGERDYRRILIDWDFAASGWWLDNREYYNEQLEGSKREKRHQAGLELRRISPVTKAALQL